MERYLSTAQVMEMLPLGRASCIKKMHELGAVTFGKKLMIRESAITAHLRQLEAAKHIPVAEGKRPRKKAPSVMLTPDGKIPTRQQLRELEKARGKNDRSKA